MEISCRDEYSGLKGIEPESTSLDRRRQTPKLRQRYNKIRGYLDWLRADFVKDAREKCSTECVFAESRSAKTLRDADGVLFHAKTHSERDFPPTKPPGAKYMLVSLEQERYAPLLKNKNYVRRFDYVMTYDLDSTLPMITIHPHWDAAHYFAPEASRPFRDREDAVAAFVSNCKNAGAEKRLELLRKLNATYPVHSYGKCLHNIDEPPLRKGENRGDAKRKLLGRDDPASRGGGGGRARVEGGRLFEKRKKKS